MVGRSREGRGIAAFANFSPTKQPPPGVTFVLGGVHGDEPASHELVAEFAKAMPAGAKAPGPILALPLLNPDGLHVSTRYNASGVDLNRNCETAWSKDSEEPPGPYPWSEPENQALHDVILTFRPAKIVTLHWALAELDADGEHSRPLLDAMWQGLSPAEQSPYRAVLSTSPAFPGSLGAWCGYGLRYPDDSRPAIVTLELPAEPETARPAVLPSQHFRDMVERWQRDSAEYMDLVRPGVMKMLLAACACPA
jgi:hypothetical protein